METNDHKNDILFELSWEVCNKVGGIHTVITSKSKEIMKYFSNYYFMGPYFQSSLNNFEEIDVPDIYKQQYDELINLGIKIHFGKWNIESRAEVILIEYLSYSSNINDIKKILWEKYKIDSLNSQWYDFDEAILWSWVCGIVIEKLCSKKFENVLIHSHEWMSGGAIFYLKQNRDNESKFKTIFTTHATMLGRSLSGNGNNLYEITDKINPDEKSYELGIHTKQQCEKALANISDFFTTVSDITNNEAKYFYSKKSDILTYNGFDNSKIKNIDELNVDFFKSRKYINEFLESYFYSSYDLNLDNTQIFYTSGRNEFKNKGVDIYIKALEKLNKILKEENSKREIINLFLIPIGEFNLDKSIENSINSYNSKLVPERINKIAPLSSHELPNDNEIIKALIESDLVNRKDDKVKNIILPFYLDGKNKIINKKYYKLIQGLDLGIFPSFYEPWGYTPMESISYAVPTVTSDLAGFGKYILKNLNQNLDEDGVYILKRNKLSREESIEELYEILYEFSKKSQKELLLERNNAKEFAKEFDWSKFINNYIKIYNKVLENKSKKSL